MLSKTYRGYFSISSITHTEKVRNNISCGCGESRIGRIALLQAIEQRERVKKINKMNVIPLDKQFYLNIEC